MRTIKKYLPALGAAVIACIAGRALLKHDKPDLSGLHHELLVTLVGSGRDEEAERAAVAWLSNHPGDWLHRETLSKLYFKSGRYGAARAELESILGEKGEDPKLLRMLVEAALEEGNQAAAVNAINRALKSAGLSGKGSSDQPLSANDAATARICAMGFVRFEDFAAALPWLKRLHGSFPEDMKLQALLGRALRAAGLHEEARKFLEPLHADPFLGTEALYETALSFAKEGRHDQAVKLFARALERDPANGVAYHQLALSLERLGKAADAGHFEEASAALARSQREKIRGIEKRSASQPMDALYAEAMSLSLSGRFREADLLWEESPLRKKPEALLLRARLYLEWLRGKEAFLLLEPLSGGSLKPWEVKRLRAYALRLEGFHDKAETLFKELSEGDPGNAAYRDDLKRMDEELKDERSRAVREAREEAAREPWPEAAPLLLKLARLLAPLDREEAVRTARLAAAADSTLPEAWRALGRLLVGPGELFYRLEAWQGLLASLPQDEEAARESEKAKNEIDRLPVK